MPLGNSTGLLLSRMKVFICKFFNEEDIERSIRRLVAREKKRAGDKLSVFCVDEQIQKRLEAAGITVEVLRNFHSRAGADIDEPSWQKTYKFSDELKASSEANDSLKFHGINFLTLEYDISRYILVTKLSTLFNQMMPRCKLLIIILNKPYHLWVPDIRSPNIRTLRFGVSLESPKVVWWYNSALRVGALLLRVLYAMRLGSLLSRVLPLRARRYLDQLASRGHPTQSEKTPQQQHMALFVVSTQLDARPALAICNECLRNGLTPYVVPYSSDMAQIFLGRHYNIAYLNKINLISFLSLVSKAGNVFRLLQRLKKHIGSFHNLSARDTASNEFSVEHLYNRALQNELAQLCFVAIYYIILFEKLIDSLSPDILCLMPDGYFLQQMAAAVAKKYNIPTLACSASLETGNARSYMKHLHADKIAAMGEVIKNIYIESGVAPERITVTGVAHFDRLFDRNKEQDARVLQTHDIDPNKRTIVFGTDNLAVSETVKALTGVIKTVLKTKDIQLVVKVHPRESFEPYQDAVEEYHDPRIHVVKDIDLYALLSRCELVIVNGSTIALEAMMIGKLVVTINLSGKSTPVPYAEEGAALGVYKFEDIEPAIQKVLYNEETRASLRAGRDKFVRAWAGEPDGNASLRIVNLMKEIIESNKTGKGRLETS